MLLIQSLIPVLTLILYISISSLMNENYATLSPSLSYLLTNFIMFKLNRDKFDFDLTNLGKVVVEYKMIVSLSFWYLAFGFCLSFFYQFPKWFFWLMGDIEFLSQYSIFLIYTIPLLSLTVTIGQNLPSKILVNSFKAQKELNLTRCILFLIYISIFTVFHLIHKQGFNSLLPEFKYIFVAFLLIAILWSPIFNSLYSKEDLKSASLLLIIVLYASIFSLVATFFLSTRFSITAYFSIFSLGAFIVSRHFSRKMFWSSKH